MKMDGWRSNWNRDTRISQLVFGGGCLFSWDFLPLTVYPVDLLPLSQVPSNRMCQLMLVPSIHHLLVNAGSHRRQSIRSGSVADKCVSGDCMLRHRACYQCLRRQSIGPRHQGTAFAASPDHRGECEESEQQGYSMKDSLHPFASNTHQY